MNADYIIIQIKTSSTGAKTQTILINTKLHENVSSRLAAASYSAPPSVASIRSEMDSYSTKLANLDATISSRLPSASYTAPDNSGISAIKAKTDNLPASPAAVGSAMTVSDKTGFYLAADQAVNATKIGGVIQTGRDLGAGVLVSDKTGFSLAADQAVNCTKWNGHAVLEVVSGSPVVTLGAVQAAYAPAKAGDAMALTAASVDAIWDEVASGHATAGSFGKYLDSDISANTDHITADYGPAEKAAIDLLDDAAGGLMDIHADLATVAGYIDTEVAAILAAVDTEVAAIKAKTELLTFVNTHHLEVEVQDKTGFSLSVTPPTAVQIRTEMDSNSTKLANLDATVSSRLAGSSYTAPDNASIAAIKAKTDMFPVIWIG